MNKKIIKMAIAALACVTICGTTLAAPAPRGGRGPAPAKQQQKAPALKPAQGRGHEKAPAHGHEVAHRGAPAPAHHPAPVRHPAPPPPAPRHEVIHVEHHEAIGLAVLGGAIVGGIVGALVH